MSKVQQLQHQQHPPSIAAIRLRAQKNYYSSQIQISHPENGSDNSSTSKISANKTRDDFNSSVPTLNHSRDEVKEKIVSSDLREIPGMRRSQLTHISQPQQQLASPPTESSSGAGIGRGSYIRSHSNRPVHGGIKSSNPSDSTSSLSRKSTLDDLVDSCLPDLQSSGSNNNTHSGGSIGRSSSQHDFNSNKLLTMPSPDVVGNDTKTDTFTRFASKSLPANLSVESSLNTCIEIGLENLGNTCFMNSMLQCLLHIKPLIQYFLHSSNLDRDLNLSSPKKGVLATSFHQLVMEVSNKTNGATVSPIHFQRAVCTYAPYLMDYQQQDSQEFLRFLLDGMSEDLCRKPVQQLINESNNNSHRSTSAASKSSNTSVSVSGSGTSNSGSKIALGNGSNSMTMKSIGTILPMLPQHTTSTESSPNSQASCHTKVNATNNNDHTEFSPQNSGNLSQKLRSETRAMRENQSQHLQLVHNIPQQGGVNFMGGAALTRMSSRGMETFATSSAAFSGGDDALREEEDSDDSSAVIQVHTQPTAKAKLFADIKLSRKLNSSMDTLKGAMSQNQSEIDERAESSTEKVSKRVIHRAKLAEENGACPSDGENIAAKNDSSSSSTYLEICMNESRKAWNQYLKLNDSIITDIFGGQLQSTITCLTCHNKSSSYDPFLDLSVPIYRDGNGDAGQSSRTFLGSIRSSSSSDSNKSTLEKCLQKFTAEEILDGDNMYTCEKCKQKRKSVKKLTIFKYPRVLVIHIKRFRFSTTAREKLSTDVLFPLSDLDLSSFISPDILCFARDKEFSTRERLSMDTAAESAAKNNNNNNNNSTQKFNHHSTVKTSVEEGASSQLKSTSSSNLSGSNEQQQQSERLTLPRVHTPKNFPPVEDIAASPSKMLNPYPNYDLIGVSNHHGNLHGGHYIAHVDTNGGDRSDGKVARWMCFNDARISVANANSIAGPTAYVLFYKMREET